MEPAATVAIAAWLAASLTLGVLLILRRWESGSGPGQWRYVAPGVSTASSALGLGSGGILVARNYVLLPTSRTVAQASKGLGRLETIFFEIREDEQTRWQSSRRWQYCVSPSRISGLLEWWLTRAQVQSVVRPSEAGFLAACTLYCVCWTYLKERENHSRHRNRFRTVLIILSVLYCLIACPQEKAASEAVYQYIPIAALVAETCSLSWFSWQTRYSSSTLEVQECKANQANSVSWRTELNKKGCTAGGTINAQEQ